MSLCHKLTHGLHLHIGNQNVFVGFLQALFTSKVKAIGKFRTPKNFVAVKLCDANYKARHAKAGKKGGLIIKTMTLELLLHQEQWEDKIGP